MCHHHHKIASVSAPNPAHRYFHITIYIFYLQINGNHKQGFRPFLIRIASFGLWIEAFGTDASPCRSHQQYTLQLGKPNQTRPMMPLPPFPASFRIGMSRSQGATNENPCRSELPRVESQAEFYGLLRFYILSVLLDI
jgi:hypothetical protein